MKTLKNTIAIITVLLVSKINLNSQNWQWAKHFGGNADDFAVGACTDGSGNFYSTGSFINGGQFGATTLTANGIQDIYISKMDGNGNIIWAKGAGGTEPSGFYGDNGGNIIYESSSNTLITGGTLNGNGETIGSCALGNGVKSYLSKLDLNGNCIWAVGFAFFSMEGRVGGITTDNNGSIYLTGYIGDSIYFSGSTFLQKGSYIAKFNSSNGALIWVKNIMRPHTSTDIVYRDNSLFLSGTVYLGMSHFDTLLIDTITNYCYKDDVFISKFDTLGNAIWAKTIGGANSDVSGKIEMDGGDNIYLCGHFTDTAYFGSVSLTNALHTDGFIAKYSSNGNLIWVKQLQTTGAASTNGLSTDNNGNTYFVGEFSGTLNLGAYTAVSTSSNDLFLVRFDSSGACLGVKTVGNIFYVNNVITNNDGGCYVAGGFNSTTNFDSHTITSYGMSDTFIAKLDAITGMEDKMLVTNNTLIIYANPNKGTCNITVPKDLLNEQNLILNIYDSNGKLIQQQPVQVQQEKVKINIEAEATGVYNVTLGNVNKMYSGKIVFE